MNQIAHFTVTDDSARTTKLSVPYFQ